MCSLEENKWPLDVSRCRINWILIWNIRFIPFDSKFNSGLAYTPFSCLTTLLLRRSVNFKDWRVWENLPLWLDYFLVLPFLSELELEVQFHPEIEHNYINKQSISETVVQSQPRMEHIFINNQIYIGDGGLISS